MVIMNSEIDEICKIVSENKIKYQSGELRRLFHGRGDNYGKLKYLNVDLFPPVLLATFYEEKKDEWLRALSQSMGMIEGVKAVVFQHRNRTPWISKLMTGELPDDHIVVENGLRYSVSLDKGVNPGIFLDMREGRNYVRSISEGKRILNLFAYTCPFSVAAAEGGAISVLNIDMNRNSLNRGRVNHRLNGDKCDDVCYLNHNILKSFGKIEKKGPYDLIVIDPPPSQGTSFSLERDYGKLLRRTSTFLGEKGEVLACLNSHTLDFDWFKSFLKENLGEYELLKEMGACDDFPEKNPQYGLKIIHLRLDSSVL